MMTAVPFSPVAPIDRLRSDPDNEAMYKRAAKRVKDWRRDHAMNQIAFADRAKISVGCLQGFETGARATREANLVKIANAVGLSRDALLHDDDPITSPNPLLAGLRDEDLRHAQHFHHATAHAKAAAYDWLGPKISDDLRERIAGLVERLLRMDVALFGSVEQFIADIDEGAPGHRVGKTHTS
jgi:transcriptional regulator with XRE-family HTH domain